MDTRHLGLIEREGLPDFWLRLARTASEWLTQQRLSPRDAVLLLPFAQHIAPARRAWSQLGSWQPRITTSRSLASSLGPTALAAPGQISLDAAMDAFTADRLLADQSWAQTLKQRDPRTYQAGRTKLVETAHLLLRASSERPPEQRAGFFAAVRARLLAQASGPGDVERALALVAVAWAESDDRRPATDALFALQPSAWLVLRVGGADPLSQALLAGERPGLLLDAELDLDAASSASPVEQAVCPDFEALAEQTATAVVQHLNAGRTPVALLAQDRVVIRRVRALLGRSQVPLHDETGWTLATTPAAAALLALLRAVLTPASVDDWLAWMKSALAADWDAAALSELEALCRRKAWRRPQRLDGLMLPLWQRAREATRPLSGGPRKLGEWLTDLGRVLRGLSPLDGLEGAGAMLDALWIHRNPWPESAHEALIGATRLRPDEFLAWVDATLEAAQFTPEETAQADVVITPLARALLRPFGAVVLPGADAATLAPPNVRAGLLSDADCEALGLPTLAEQRQAQTLAFAQLLRSPTLTVLRCDHAGNEPLPASPLLERLEAARGSPLPDWVDPREAAPTSARPQVPAEAQPGRLPAMLSASSIEALRNCPYQFFSRHVLGLREPEELDTEPDKRDYGTWLHAVLRRFHEARDGDDAEALQAAAEAELARLDAADFLPYSAAFQRLAPRYLEWLGHTEAQGQHFEAGELDRRCQPFDPPLQDLTLQGRIDRLDATPAGPLVLDYKTGQAKDLKERLKQPLEDTQLAAYALLMGSPPGLQAAYLALDEPKGLTTVPHEGVSESATALRDGLQVDLAQLLGGAALPALGEGRICELCEARGLCRKDDWA